jgi:hypothetical protein
MLETGESLTGQGIILHAVRSAVAVYIIYANCEGQRFAGDAQQHAPAALAAPAHNRLRTPTIKDELKGVKVR